MKLIKSIVLYRLMEISCEVENDSGQVQRAEFNVLVLDVAMLGVVAGLLTLLTYVY